FFDMGGIQLELIEPMGGDSSWQSGLDATGPGLHHIAFWTEDAAADVAALREQGAEVWHRGDMGGAGQYVYLRGGPLVGATIELLENQRTEIG
ncbi:MAG: VOC family protein, partial [Fimbriimonadaceae bacterium]|nr:VOC family protein [Fimbriimonadaceae bacterium]